MRVLHISQRYLPARGGAEEHLAHISRRLVRAGHSVTILTTDAFDIELFWNPSGKRIAEREAEIDGARVLRFPVRHLPAPGLAYAGVRRLLWLASALRLPTGPARRGARLTPRVPELEAWLAKTPERFDVVGTTTICFEGLIDAGARFARRTTASHLVYPLTHLGAGARPGADELSRFYTMRHQVALAREADCVVAMTPAERDFYAAAGADPRRIAVIGSAVEPGAVLGGDGEAFRAKHGTRGPLVVSLSAMMADKGTTHLVDAVRMLWREGRDVDIALAGAVMPEFAAFMNALPEADRRRVRVLGPISDEEKRDLLAAADIFAMPSRTDSFGIVYLEAWLYGKPVIGARTWGVMDVIRDGVDGLLVPFGDPAQLAAALGSLLDDPARRAAMGEAGRAKVHAEHTWEKKFPQIEALYCGLAERGKHPCAS
jgi:glycosyltransferase involved in cell wall biosynthesis